MPDFKFNNKLYYNPVEFAMDRIGGTWKMPILWRLQDKTMRFSALKVNLKRISDKMLATQLRELEAEGFIKRKVFAQVPPRVEYSITKRGKRAVEVVDYLRLYGLELMKEFKVDKQKIRRNKSTL